MKDAVRFFVSVMMVATPSGVAAQGVPTRVTAGTLLQVCDESRPACLTYVMGAIDGVVATLVASGRRNPLCVPDNVNNQQVADAAAGYIRAHPEEASKNAATVVIVALTRLYPCPPY